MADGVNYLKMATPTPAHRLKPGEYDGRVKVMTDIVVLAGDTGAVNMCGTLPLGAIVLGVFVSMEALGAAIDVGDAENTTRYFSAQASGAVRLQQGDELAGINYEVDMTTPSTPDNQIIVTLAGASTGTLKLTVLYAHD